MAGQNWVIATVLAGIAGILIAPVSTVDPTSYTLFIVPALGVALVGRFQSFWLAALAGLLLGCAQSEITKLLTVWTWLPAAGPPQDAIPFVVIMVVMTLLSRAVGARGGETTSATRRSGGRHAATRPHAACFVVGVILLIALHGSLRFAFISSLVVICIALSLVVLTGYVGQVSLGADVVRRRRAASMLGHISSGWGHRLPVVADPRPRCARCPSGCSSACRRCGCAA